MDLSHHHQNKVLSRLSLLLRRCLTPATVQRPQQNLEGLQTYRRIYPLALQKGSGPTTKDCLWRLPENKQYNTNLPKRPEYGTLTRRTRTFYQGPAQWDPEGKPSVGSIAAAGFYYDGGLTIIII